MSKINVILLIFISILFISISVLKHHERTKIRLLKKNIMINLVEKAPINICENVSNKYKNEVELISRGVFDSNKAYLNESYNYSGLKSINLLYDSKDNYELCFSNKKTLYKPNFKYPNYDYFIFIDYEKNIFLQDKIEKEKCENGLLIVDKYLFCFDYEQIVKI